MLQHAGQQLQLPPLSSTRSRRILKSIHRQAVIGLVNVYMLLLWHCLDITTITMASRIVWATDCLTYTSTTLQRCIDSNLWLNTVLHEQRGPARQAWYGSRRNFSSHLKCSAGRPRVCHSCRCLRSIVGCRNGIQGVVSHKHSSIPT